MRQAKILYNEEEAGMLMQHDDGTFTFQYNDGWVTNQGKPPISLTLPKTDKAYHSKHLFPFFFHMLPEGSNKQLVCRLMRIDEDDDFGILLTTAQHDTIGAVTVMEMNESI